MRKIILITLLIISCFSFAQNAKQQQARNNYLLAENYYRAGEYEKATQLYKKLYEYSPFNTNYLGRLIACYQETNQFLDAKKLLNERIKANNKHIFLFVYLGYNFERNGDKEKAEENYTIALKALEKIPSYGGLLGRIFKDYNLLDKAILAYQKAMEANKNANYNFQIAQIYGEKAAYKEMFEAYINMVDKNERYYTTVLRDISKYITDDAENEANILFRKTLLKKSLSKPKDVWNVLLSWLFTQQKQYGKALLQEKALYQRLPEDLSTIFTLAKIAFENEAYEASEECFNYIIEKTSNKNEAINAHLFLAKIAIATKNPETENLFQDLFREFGKNSATINLQVAYADFLTFSANQPEQANKVLEEALLYANSKFSKARIKLKLGDVLVFTGKYNKALIYFSQIQTQLKNHVLAQEARFKVAQTSYFKGDFEWAKAQAKVLKGSTTQLIANDAVDLFLKISDNEPVDSIPSGLKQLANAELLAFQNKDDEALMELDNLINSKDILINGLIPSEVIYDDVFFFRAKLLIKQEKYEEAILDLAKIVAADNQGFLTDDVYFIMAEMYEKLNNTEKAQKYYQKIIFDYPSSIFLVDARKRYRKLRGDTI
ncbi:tetratricopeptide repeat protein [uncultured Polaribacter sp.]|uniref:tetratricopeptide repeat protein n=1 Tax=uncultured Polaribacter sp. TaxID=174711 RepID=UPI002622E962|nr:tetratricopeptide repeat protein [uncultured Polaribacter sp.]